MNYTILPNLTIQYYGQPFISRGRYESFKFITDPLAKSFTDRFEVYDNQQIFWDEKGSDYLIDENRDGVIDYSIGQPDFNFMQFRSNLVLRWEYVPGSEFFLVWSQNTTQFGDPADSLLPSLQQNLFSEQAHNIFLVKLTYRFLK